MCACKLCVSARVRLWGVFMLMYWCIQGADASSRGTPGAHAIPQVDGASEEEEASSVPAHAERAVGGGEMVLADSNGAGCCVHTHVVERCSRLACAACSRRRTACLILCGRAERGCGSLGSEGVGVKGSEGGYVNGSER